MSLPWFAVYTKSRHEKKSMDLLIAKGIEAYVPLRRVLKQWSDRKKWVEEPMMRSYCFVRVMEGQYQQVLNTPGVVRYVYFSGKPAPIPNRQIDILKAVAGAEVEAEVVTGNFEPGMHVRVMAGPLAGIEGELISVSGKKKVVIRIDHLEQMITVSISPLLLERMKESVGV